MPRNELLEELDKQLRELEHGLEVAAEPEQEVEPGLYQRIFGEGIVKNVDDYYGISPKAKKAWDTLTSLVPVLGKKETYMPKTATEDREWLERFLQEGTP